MNSTLTFDINAIRSRSEDLKSIEENLRRGREQTGETRWPFGDMIRATLADAQSLVARVEELEAALAARRDSPSLLSAVLGSLRADGYQVTAPGVPVAPAPESAPPAEPTVRKFDAAWLKSDEIGLPSGYGQAVVLSDKILDQGRWSTHHEIVFRLPDQPEPFAWRAKYSEGSTEIQEERPWEYTKEVECTLVRLAPRTVQEWVPARDDVAYDGSVFDLVAAASGMLANDEPDDYGPEDPAAESNPRGAGVICGPRLCPSCEKPLPPDGKCLSPYVDCQKTTGAPLDFYTNMLAETAEVLKPLENGASLRLAGGVWDGRYAIALGTISDHGHRHCVQVVARGAELAGARTIDAAMVFVVNPAVDELVAKTGPIHPPSDAPTTPAEPARKRAEEPPVAIADWTLTDKDIAEVAAKLNRTVDEVKRLVAAFKVAMKDRAPTPRWRPAFTAWAAKNATSVLAQATIPGA